MLFVLETENEGFKIERIRDSYYDSEVGEQVIPIYSSHQLIEIANKYGEVRIVPSEHDFGNPKLIIRGY